MTVAELSRVTVVGLGQMGRGNAHRLDTAGLLCGAPDKLADTSIAADLSVSEHEAPLTEFIASSDVPLLSVPSTGEIEQVLADGHADTDHF